MFHHILVPVDGSDATNAAVDTALRLAREQKAVVRFVTVVEETVSVLERLGRAAELPNPRVITEAHKEVLRDVTNTANQHGCSADFEVIDGAENHAGDLIAQAARRWGADLIVMGSHARGGMARLTLGSVTEVTIRHTDVPVLVVPTRAAVTLE